MGGVGSGRRKSGEARVEPTPQRTWPVRNPQCTDLQLQNEVVERLTLLHDVLLAELVVDGEPNPLCEEFQDIHDTAVEFGVILPTHNGGDLLVVRMAKAAARQAQ